MMLTTNLCSDFRGGRYLCQRRRKKEVGDSVIYTASITLLAKQAWRLIENTDSLCATIQRAKYYPDGDLLCATLRTGHRILDEASWQELILSIKDMFGELETDKVLISGLILGSNNHLRKSYPKVW